MERTETFPPNLPSPSTPPSQRQHDCVCVVCIVGVVLNVEVVGVVVVLVVVVVVVAVVVVHIGNNVGGDTSCCQDKVEEGEGADRTCRLAILAFLRLIWFRFQERVFQL